MIIEIKDTIPNFKTLVEIKKQYKEEEIVEIVNRYVEWRRQQKKYMRTQQEKLKIARKVLKDPDVAQKLKDMQDALDKLDNAIKETEGEETNGGGQ